MQTDVTIKAGIGGANRSLGMPQRTEANITAVKAGSPDDKGVTEARSGDGTASGTLEQAVAEISAAVQNTQRNLNFSVDESSGRTVIKVIDATTEEVIRQIPSEEALALARNLRESGDSSLSGLLMQSQA